ncbi:MAG: InlB B-repeat-containing protein [Lachnospiraceae bacterium]|nr:InlB B-repeat-containing protein [Candidatus Colinaster scatohippi]
MKKLLARKISLLLSVLMLFSSVDMQAFAMEAVPDKEIETVVGSTEEIVSTEKESVADAPETEVLSTDVSSTEETSGTDEELSLAEFTTDEYEEETTFVDELLIESGECGNGIKYAISGDIYEGIGITFSGTGRMDDYSSSDDVPWKNYKNKISKVVVEDGVENVGSFAFEGFSILDSVNLASTVTEIGRSTFKDCTGLKEFPFSDGLLRIEDYAFEGCMGLTDKTIPLPATLKYMGSGVFSGLSSKGLTLTIPANVIEMKTDVFAGMVFNNKSKIVNKSVATADLPQIDGYDWYETDDKAKTPVRVLNPKKTVAMVAWTVGSYYEGECGENVSYKLTVSGKNSSNANVYTLELNGTGPTYDYNNDSANPNRAPWYSKRKVIDKIIIADGITRLGNYLFYETTGVTKAVEMPDSVREIGTYTFWKCYGIMGDFTLPANITTIGSYAFRYCYQLDGTLTFSEGIQTIGSGAFYNCYTAPNGDIPSKGIKGTVVIPSTVTSFGGALFDGNKDIDKIINYSAKALTLNKFNGYKWVLENDETKTAVSTVSKNQTVVKIPIESGEVIDSGSCGPNLKYELTSNENSDIILTITGTGPMDEQSSESKVPWYNYRSQIVEINLPEGMTTIGYNAFKGCSNSKLTSVRIPSTVTKISTYGFYGASYLSGVDLPAGLTSIGTGAFYGCSKLAGNLIIPDSVTDINKNAFYNCYALKSLTLPKNLKKIGDTAFYNCYGLNCELILPEGITSIGTSSFKQCKALTGILCIPSSLTTISSNAFLDCKKLEGLSIANGPTKIATSAFEGCEGMSGELIIPDSVVNVESRSFYGCNFSGTLSVSNNLKFWGDDVVDLTKFEKIYNPSTIPIDLPQIEDYKWIIEEDPNEAEIFRISRGNAELIERITPVTVTLAPRNGQATTTVTVVYGKPYGELLSGLKRTGYEFDDWYTRSVGGVRISPDVIVKNDAPHTLYAHWNPLSVRVNFDANGGELDDIYNNIAVTYSKAYGELPTPVYPGYTFTGWYTESVGGNLITSSTRVKALQDQTLYAHWMLGVYTVSFDANGGTVAQNNKSVTNSKQYGDLPTPTRSGYTFLGWFTEEEAGEKIDRAAIVDLTEDQTLYAHWKAATIKVTFALNGGTYDGLNTKNVTYGATYGTLPEPVKQGYSFDGWFTSKDGGTKIEDTTTVTVTQAQTLYAHYSAKSITVSFEPMGGEVETENKIVEYDCEYGELPEPVKSGYRFAGWYTEEADGELITADDIVATTDNHTLYAYWTALKYRVTFNGNGGTVSPRVKDITYDDAYGTLPVPVREGYIFDGWFTAVSGGSQVIATDIYKVADAQTLYAHYTAKGYKVSFDANGGETDTNEITVAYDSAYGELPEAVRTGFAFAGWYTEIEDGIEVLADDIVKISENQTLYAYWIANIYELTFDGNGGTANRAGKNITYGQAYGDLATATRAGYSFDGWYTEKIGGVLITADSIVNITDSQILYAHYVPRTYKISFDANGGSTDATDITVTFDSAYGELPTATKQGYNFMGWYNSSASTGILIKSDSIVKTASNQTLYARFAPKTYKVTFDCNGGTISVTEMDITYDDIYGELPQATRAGYGFTGWYTEKEDGIKISADTIVKEEADLTLYAHFEANRYKLTFNANGGFVSSQEKNIVFDSAYGELPNASATGYTFAGWYTEKTGGTRITEESIVGVLANQILYAHYTPNRYTLVFDANQGTVAKDSQEIIYDQAYGELPVPERTGYVFGGWYTEIKAGTVVKAGDIVKVTANQTLYAHWMADGYGLIFNANGGIVDTDGKDINYDDPYGELPTPTREGYDFTGWYTDESTGKKIESTDIFKETGTQVLYAHYSAIEYNLLFDACGGRVETEQKKITYDGKYGELPDAEKTGYTFTGWYTGKTEGEKVSSESVVKTASDRTLYAHYTVNSYKLTFDAGAGVVDVSEKTIVYDSKYGELALAQRAGYSFDGWYTEKDGGKKITSEDTVDISDDVTLYAHYSAMTYVLTLNAQGGSVSPDSLDITYDSVYGELPDAERTGYTFVGWYTMTEGGEKIEASDIVIVTDSQVLYAHYTANTYEVSYDSNGGNTVSEKTVVTYGKSYGVLAETERTGYTFEGWFTAKEDGQEITSVDIVDIVDDITLYAHWIPNTYSLNFDGNGGKAAIVSKDIIYDMEYGELPGASKTGYEFVGWFTDEKAGTEIKASDIVKVTSSQTLYAHYTANKYILTFDAGEIEVTPDKKEITFDAKYGELPSPEKTGYTFGGWYTEASGSGTEITADSVVGVTDNQTLYAYFTPDIFTVEFNTNGAVGVVADKSVVYDEKYGELPSITRTGYAFNGWFTEKEAGEQVKEDSLVKITTNQILYAHWSANIYTLTFDAIDVDVSPNTKDITYDSSYGDLPVPKKTGYTFEGWYTGVADGNLITEATVVKVTDNQTVYAHYSPKQFELQYDANGGLVSHTGETVTYDDEYGELVTPLRVGYTFAGWYTEKEAGTEIRTGDVVKITENVTIYAHWEVNSYKVIFDSVGGSPAETEKVVVFDAKYGELPQPQMLGYTFSGWFTESENGEKITADSIVAITDEQRLFAHWTANRYNLYLDANDGKTPVSSRKIAYEDEYGELPEIKRTGYTFAGWFTDPIEGVEVASDTSYDIADDSTLYAHWIAIEYKLTLDANTGTVNVAEVKVAFGGPYGELPKPAKAGHTFEGWYTEKEAGTEVTEDKIVTTAAAHTVYAHWSVNNYLVSFDAGEVVLDITEKEVTFGEEYGELPTPEKEGYTFTGWYTEKEAGTQVKSTSIVDIEKDITLYAHFEANSYTLGFVAQPGKASYYDKQVTYGDMYGDLADAERAGYDFDGWFTEEEEGTEISSESVVVTAKDHKVYAHWSPKKYKLTFDSNTGECEVSEKEVIFGEEYGELPVPVKTGYEFKGWYTEKEAGTVVRDTTRCGASDKTVYARFAPKTIILTYDACGGSVGSGAKKVKYDDVYGELATPTRVGYAFAGWFTTPKPVQDEEDTGVRIDADSIVDLTEDATIYGRWEENVYNLTFDTCGGAFDSEITGITIVYDSKYGELPIPVKDSYTFEGWYTMEPGGELITEDSIVKVTADQLLYARWEVTKYSITFDACGGKVSADEAVRKLEYNEIYGTLPVPERRGFTFAGWYSEPNGCGEKKSAADIITSDIILYAGWISCGLRVENLKEGYVYTGGQIRPEIQVYEGEELLKEKVDYTISYRANVAVNVSGAAKTQPTIIITGRGNYSGKDEVPFEIVGKSIEDEDVVIGDIPAVLYNKKPQKGVPKMTFGKLKLNTTTDTKIEYFEDEDCNQPVVPCEVGTYYVRITGQRNYTGTVVKPFIIASSQDCKLVSKLKMSKLPSVIYTGDPIDIGKYLTVMDGTTLLTEGVEYTIDYKGRNHTDIGVVTFEIVGDGETYIGSKEMTFKITGAMLKSLAISGFEKAIPYNDEEPMVQAITLRDNRLGVEVNGISTEEYKELTEEERSDYGYTFDYLNNSKAGVATLKLTGVNAYTGVVSKNYVIQPYNIATDVNGLMTFALKETEFQYNRAGVKPEVVVTYKGNELTEGKDYTVKYTSNVAVTTEKTKKKPTVEIKGIGNFSGTNKSLTFKILTRSFNQEEGDTHISMIALDREVSRKENGWRSPVNVVDENGKKLVYKRDYKDVAYSLEDGTVPQVTDFLDVGTRVYVTAELMGCYEGTISTNYTIVAKDIAQLSVTVNNGVPFAYTTKPVTIENSTLTFKKKRALVREPVTYRIDETSYKNNIYKGTASVVIYGTGEYGGYKTVTYRIGTRKIWWFWR